MVIGSDLESGFTMERFLAPMTNWRDELNRITVEFWCGVGMLEELPNIADAANIDLGEAHPDIWQFYTCTSDGQAKDVTSKVAFHLNRFVPESWEALPYAQDALKRALDNFAAHKMSVHALCRLVQDLDSTFNINLSDLPQPASLSELNEWWMGTLWDCCDWCGENRTHEDHPSLLAEARRVATMLSEIAFKRSRL